MALVIALALSTGFKEDIQGKISAPLPPLNLIRLDGTYILNHDELLKRIDGVPHVTGRAPAIFQYSLISQFGTGPGRRLERVSPAREGQVSDFLPVFCRAPLGCL